MEKTVQYEVQDFNGPLDLLLALVQKHKMSIYDIEIVTLIDQYLAVVGAINPDELEGASEFIAMAARLVQMKSYFLLPKSDEADRMKQELTGLLVEYSACKEIAGQLSQMAEKVYIVVRKPVEVEFDTTYTGRHDVKTLLNAFSGIVGRSSARRLPRQEQFEEIVAAPFVSVASRVMQVLRGLKTGRLRQLREVFVRCTTRGETVATFLALLELIRGGRVTINDDEQLELKRNRADARAGKMEG